VLMALHQLDPRGDTFRYSTTWDKQQGKHVPAARPSESHIDVVAMGQHFRGAASLLGGGVATVLDVYADYQAEMLREAQW
jgi:hypothetical protein